MITTSPQESVSNMFDDFWKAGNRDYKVLAVQLAAEGGMHVESSSAINPYKLIPKTKDYFYYMGSLTTPPCTEGLVNYYHFIIVTLLLPLLLLIQSFTKDHHYINLNYY